MPMPAQIPFVRTLLVISVFFMLLFAGCGAVAYLRGADAAIDRLTEAIIINFTTIIGFWFGSSSGSQKKDNVLASQLAPNPPPVPPPPPPAHVG